MRKIISVILISSLLFSCDKMLQNKEFEGGEFFYLQNKGAVMPVWVKGNISSKTFVIFLHGGPGNSSAMYANAGSYKELQKDYAFVYYDQRGSGASQGNAKPESFNIDQFVADIEKLVQLLQKRYGVSQYFLIGKSWGGCIGTAYLLKPENQQKIKGWIEIDGAHNLKDGIKLSWEWVKTKAQEKIDLGIDVKYWNGEIAWYNTCPENIDTKYFMRHGKNVNTLNGIYLNPAHDPGNGYAWASPIPALYLLNTLHINNSNSFDMKNIDLSGEMNKITIPSMVLWGRNDGTLPVALAEYAFNNLGTSQANKYMFIFENSGHVPSIEEPGLFIERIKMFIEKYK